MVIDNIVVYNDYIEEIIDQFKIDNQIENISDIPQNTFNYLMTYIYNNTFKTDKRILYTNSRLNNEYNIEIIDNLLSVYKNLCDKYNKIPSIIGFSNLTGIHRDTIYTWNEKLSSKGHYMLKTIKDIRLESLVNKLSDGKSNPVGLIAIANNEFNWSTSNSKSEQIATALLTAAELPKFNKQFVMSSNDQDDF